MVKLWNRGSGKIRPYFTFFQALDLMNIWKLVMRKYALTSHFSSSGFDKMLKKGDEKIGPYLTLFRALDLMKSWKIVDEKIRSYFTFFRLWTWWKFEKKLWENHTVLSDSSLQKYWFEKGKTCLCQGCIFFSNQHFIEKFTCLSQRFFMNFCFVFYENFCL